MRLLTHVSRRIALVSLAAAVVFPAFVSAASEGPGNLDPVLRTRARQWSGRSRVIVEFRGNPDATVITRDGGVPRRRLARMRAQVAEVDNADLETLASQPDVARVLSDRRAFATIERSGASLGATFARWQFGLSGAGIGIAVIDSGVAALHDDLNLANPLSPRVSQRVVHFRDFTREDNGQVWLSEQPTDDFGHGTHVAGIIAGNGFDSNGGRTGIAPRANLIALKVLDANGQGYVSDVIDAIDYAISVKDTYNIRVINLSVATGVYESFTTDPLALAAKRAVDAGIVVVAAAGNLGDTDAGMRQFGGVTCPGNAPWVLTVGAASHQGTTHRSDDTRGEFSSIGPTWIDFAAKPDLLAYGVGIESLASPNSTLYAQHPEYLLDGSRPSQFKPYLSMSGTSMAAPFVTGTVALMLEANPKLTPNAVKALLEYSAEVRPGEHPLAQGAGLLNARGAIRMAMFFKDPMRRGPLPWDVLAGEGVAWSRKIVWGNVSVGGGVPLPGSNAWQLGVTWGAGTTPAGTPITWGVNADENIVWSTYVDNIVWSTGGDDNIVWSTRDDGLVWRTTDAENIVWSTAHMQNVVWGGDCGGANCRRTLWGTRGDDGTLWGTADDDDNIVWSTTDDDNIVWSTSDADDDNIVWSTGENIVWSTADDNIVWSTTDDDNIVWSTLDNIVWSTRDDISSSTANDPVVNPSDEVPPDPDVSTVAIIAEAPAEAPAEPPADSETPAEPAAAPETPSELVPAGAPTDAAAATTTTTEPPSATETQAEPAAAAAAAHSPASTADTAASDAAPETSSEAAPASTADAAASNDTPETSGQAAAAPAPTATSGSNDNIVWSTGTPALTGTTSAGDNIVWSTGTPAAPAPLASVPGASEPPVAIEGVP